jgi:hypothetical protein
MTIQQFRDICDEVFELVDKDGKRDYRGFPSGCDECNSALEWDCEHVDRRTGKPVLCGWREKHWMYVELKNLIALRKMRISGLDINRISSFSMMDFSKLVILDEKMG